MAGLFDITPIDYGEIPSLAKMNIDAMTAQTAKMQLEKMKAQDAMLKSMQSQFAQGQQPQQAPVAPITAVGLPAQQPGAESVAGAAAGLGGPVVPGKRTIPLGQLMAMYSLTGDQENAKRVSEMGNAIFKEIAGQNPEAAAHFWNYHLAPIYGNTLDPKMMKQDTKIEKDDSGNIYAINPRTNEVTTLVKGANGPKDDDLFLASVAEKAASGGKATAGDLARLEQIKTKMVLGSTKAGMTESGNAWQYVPGVGKSLDGLIAWANGAPRPQGAITGTSGAQGSAPSVGMPRVSGAGTAASPSTPASIGGVQTTRVGPMSVFRPQEQNLVGGTREAMEKQLDQVGQTLSTINQVENNFNDKYLTFENRLKTGWSAVKEQLGQPLQGDERKELGDYSRWARNSISLINQHIKQMTGAQMSEPEAARLVKQMPNPGTNLYNMDSPTEFKTKLADLKRELMLIQARANYSRSNNLNWKDLDYSQMPAIMNARGAQIEQALKAQGSPLKGEELRREVGRRIADEFGIARVGR